MVAPMISEPQFVHLEQVSAEKPWEMNLAALERRMAEEADLADIAHMTPEERANKLAEYKGNVVRLASEEEQALDTVQQVQGVPDYWTMRALGTAIRKHRAAKKSLERLEREIAKAEQLTRAPGAGIPGSGRHAGKRKGYQPWRARLNRTDTRTQ